MKFGRKISTALYNEWRPFYIDYAGLKRILKDRTASKAWNDKDEKDFTLFLERELDKIYEFQKKKARELSHRIREAENAVKILVEEESELTAQGHGHGSRHANGSSARATHDTEAQEARGDDADEGSDDDDESVDHGYEHSSDEIEEQFHLLEEEVANLVADVHDLALYTKLNVTGFMKILKKHDKRTNRPLKPTFVQEYLEKRPFYKHNYDGIIVKLSKLYDLVRTRGHPIQGDSSAGGNQSAFVRQTTKYWVHPDNLVRLKLAILRHLPVLVFNPNKDFEAKDAAITSIYLDNEDLDLYLGRLEKTEGAEAIRLRWYGGMDVKQIFVERKTHREDWTGEKSVKSRFPIKEDKLDAFFRGEYTMDEEFEEVFKKGKKGRQEVDAMIQLANEVQYAILTRKLQPVMRTFYNRTAFQLPGDARVRISLDTELTMVREDNWDGRTRAGNHWRRMDIGIDHPFEQLPPEDKELFTYGVLEVKLQTQYGQEPPQWVMDLVRSHLVEAVPKFSKFIHGCATLLPHRVDLVPFWLPQMDADILKPDTGSVPFERKSAPPSRFHSADGSSGLQTPDRRSSSHQYTEPVSEGEEDEEMDLAPAKDERQRTGISGQELDEAIAYREKMLKERQVRDGEGQNGEGTNERTPFLKNRNTSTASLVKPRVLSIDPLAPSQAFDQTLRERLGNELDPDAAATTNQGSGGTGGEEEEALRSDERIVSRDFRAPKGKRIAVPVRIEPKVYFASERTFLNLTGNRLIVPQKWLHFSIYIGTIATALLNFVEPGDTHGLVAAAMFTLAALITIAYSAIIFVYREMRLRTRSAEGWYYDKYGPTVLSFVLISALLTNIVLRLSEL
ncbi:SPX-domain-containing protein [Thelephora ganbajun]|uniref:SPX-domain-containing protein n=1 Tax=Thelephora ganbajun TaxID=370292 RepID=A0ACB6ZGG8_THEGA|nr:SPX-domain-containing protein [Thelephora ganbajun]